MNFKKKFKKELTGVKARDIIKTTKGTGSPSKGLAKPLQDGSPALSTSSRASEKARIKKPCFYWQN